MTGKYICRGITKDKKLVYGYYTTTTDHKNNITHWILGCVELSNIESNRLDCFDCEEIIQAPDHCLGIKDIMKY